MFTSKKLSNIVLGGYLMSQISDFIQSKVFSIGKIFSLIPSPVRKSLGDCQKPLRKNKYLIRRKQLFIFAFLNLLV